MLPPRQGHGVAKKELGFLFCYFGYIEASIPGRPAQYNGLLAYLLYWFFQYIGVGVGAGLHTQRPARWAISSAVERAPDNRVVVPGL